MQDNQQTHKHLVSSASYIASGTLFSRVLGLIRDALLGAFFSRTVTDAWLVAFRIPNMFRRLFGEGALSVSFVPIFMGEASPTEKNRLLNGVFSILLLILSTLTLLGILFADPLMHLLVGQESFLFVPGKMEMTITMAKIMFVFCLFICLYAYFMAVLNSFKKFVLPAFAPLFFNIVMIVFTFLPGKYPEVFSVYWLATGVSLGGFIQMAILIPALKKHNSLPKISFQQNDKVKLVFKKMLPGLLGLGVMQIGILINTHFAAQLEEGANSWIYWSDRVLELPLSLFAVSLGTALLPTLSHHWILNEKNQMAVIANRYFRTIFLMSIPCAVGLWLLARPIVEILFLRGKFTQNDLVNTATVLQIYSFGILFFGGIRVLAPSFFAIQNTFIPAVITVVSLCVHFVLAKFLVLSHGIAGLASASMIAAGLNLFLLMICFRIYIGSLMLGQFAKSFSKYLVAAIALAATTMAYAPISEMGGHFWKTLSLLAVIAASAVVYFGILWVLKTEELRNLNQ